VKKNNTSVKPAGKIDFGGGAALLGICVASALAFALLRKADSFFLALGDAFIIEALFCLSLAWLGYLKKDGIRILPPRKNSDAEKAESWKDRVPQLGKEPPAPAPLPGPEGPGSADYARLAEAENRLRRRILTGEESLEDSGSDRGKRQAGRGNSRTLLLAAAVLFMLGVFFEYALPSLLVRLG
jgi:hypothetical protein